MKNTKDFLEKLINNEDFAKKFENIEDFESLKKKAKSEGYDISKEEFEKLKASADELSDEQLENAAGGISAKQFFKDFGKGFVQGFTGAAKIVGKVASLLT